MESHLEVIPMKESYMGKHAIYWFKEYPDLFNFCRKVIGADAVKGTLALPRLGGEFIKQDWESFKRLVKSISHEAREIGIGGYTGSWNDVIVEELYVKPVNDDSIKNILLEASKFQPDETDLTEYGIRLWWD